jgi:hypothetical protein
MKSPGSVLALGLAVALALSGLLDARAAVTTPHPIVFVTQVPVPGDFTTIGSTFGNHLGTQRSVARGGDLWIRDPDGTLRNLTAAAGLGQQGRQGERALAVRDPSPHWDGRKLVFSAIVGAPTRQFEEPDARWQLYEVSGLGAGETPVVTKVPNQPEGYHNISPVYGSDDRILFTSDRPRDGQAHLHPQLDEYEEAPTVTGIWSLDPRTGDLFLVNHAPSGAFTPQVDSFGRVVFTRWDHLQRDQQADADRAGTADYGTFNYSDEGPAARALADRSELFPEPREGSGNIAGHRFNQFFPWQVNEDGTEEETLNHVGRQELSAYGTQSFLDDANLRECCDTATRFNRFTLINDGLFQMREDPQAPGRFVGTSAPEFGTHAAGQLVALDGAPTVNADRMALSWLTAEATATPTAEGSGADPLHSGLYRDPLPLSDGQLIASHTAETRADRDEGSPGRPRSRYDFRLRAVVRGSDGVYRAGEALTAGITKLVSWYDPDNLLEHDGALWELGAVELRARPRPPRRAAALPAPEQRVFDEEGVDPTALRAELRRRGLALMVSRDVTQRDGADHQQPYNLRIPGGAQSVSSPGKVYDVSHLQLVQADLIRGLGGSSTPRPGRRVLGQLLHEPAAQLPFQGLAGAVALSPDGSVAALVPAGRAMSWQLTDGATPVVRERYWLSFGAGEIRVCASCHGVNQRSHAGQPDPQNPPESLRRLLRLYKAGLQRAAEDRVFDWAERAFPTLLMPKGALTQNGFGYIYRHYPATGEYVGVKEGRVYYWKPADGPVPIDVGALQTYLEQAARDGY